MPSILSKNWYVEVLKPMRSHGLDIKITKIVASVYYKNN